MNGNYSGVSGAFAGELGDRVQAHVEAKKAMDGEYGAARAKMLGFLEQFTTFKKLEEAWPEGKKFYQDFNADRPSANVPAVITKEINAMLGIKDKPATTE